MHVNREVVIRIWHGPQVCLLLSVASGGRGYSTMGAVGGAGNSGRADIELDPWTGLIVDHRVPYPTPVAIVEEPEPRTDETIGATLVPEIIDHPAPDPFPPIRPKRETLWGNDGDGDSGMAP